MHNQIYQGHRVRKRFGQNFLVDNVVISAIIDLINPQKEDKLIEIGPGLGALTFPLLKQVSSLIAIEIDNDLVSKLQKKAQKESVDGKLILLNQDVMKVNFNQFVINSDSTPIKIIGNLPYNISTPLIFYLLQYATFIEEMYFMLQKEVVERLTAKPNNKNYGKLSVMVQYYYQTTALLSVSCDVFLPVPKVDSAIVKLSPHQQRFNKKDFLAIGQILNKITTVAFNQRRKSIRNSLKTLFTIAELTELHLDLQARAENLDSKTYEKLACYYYEREFKKRYYDV